MALGVININQIAPANLKALYHFEADGADSSGNGKTLTNNNGVTIGPAKMGNGANFGSGNTTKYFSKLSDNLGIDGSALTMMGWVKNIDEIASGTFTLFGQSSANNKVDQAVQYEYNGGTRRVGAVRDRAGVGADSVYLTLTMGIKWHHFAYTYDNTTLKFYVNGGFMGSIAASGNGTNASVVDNIYVGATEVLVPASAFASSIIDEVGYWNTALTAKQIKNYYAWASGRMTGIL